MLLPSPEDKTDEVATEGAGSDSADGRTQSRERTSDEVVARPITNPSLIQKVVASIQWAVQFLAQQRQYKAATIQVERIHLMLKS